MEGVPKFPQMVTWPPGDPLSSKFSYFTIRLLTIILPAKFGISSFSRCRDMEGIRKFPKMVTLPPGNPFWPNFVFYGQCPLYSICVSNLMRISSFLQRRSGAFRLTFTTASNTCTPITVVRLTNLITLIKYDSLIYISYVCRRLAIDTWSGSSRRKMRRQFLGGRRTVRWAAAKWSILVSQRSEIL